MDKKTTGQQFFHIETYAKKQSRNNGRASKRKAGRQSSKSLAKQANKERENRLSDKISKQRVTTGIIREASRQKGYCDHVDAPLEPVTLYGDDLFSLEIKINNIYETYKNRVVQKSGKVAVRKIREDQHVLLSGVASHPRLSEDYFSCDVTREMVSFWLENTIDFLKEEFGESLKSVILHLDEKHPHVHFYCLPDYSYENIDGKEAPIINPLSSIHKGINARNHAEREASKNGLKGTSKVKFVQEAFGKSMSEMQDRFHESVSMKHGHERFGPKRKRFKDSKEYNQYLAGQIALEKDQYRKIKYRKEKEIQDEILDDKVRVKEEKLHEFENTIVPKAKQKARRDIQSIRDEGKEAIKNELKNLKEKVNKKISDEYFERKKITFDKLDSEVDEMRRSANSKVEKYEAKKKIELNQKYEYEETWMMHRINEIAEALEIKRDLSNERLEEFFDVEVEYIEKLNVSNRNKGIQINELKSENADLKSELKDIKDKFERLKSVFDALSEKFNYLYNHGRDSFDNIHGKLKTGINKVAEMGFFKF
ncbi:hypothetical protein [Parendozoicomonas sp. Alg238-R29]|uniref:hypothetical protein n=1 Tax=Parendozoicomonas sp. Alg238-R29 TaxID=2993446 RepID=UPI00248DAF99|nr:hypothetical protein [Parendozoicomonas sp. Alg238-R29]